MAFSETRLPSRRFAWWCGGGKHETLSGSLAAEAPDCLQSPVSKAPVDAVDVGDCMVAGSQAKWEALGVSKPPDMPEVIFFDLADKLPPEEEWDSGKHPQVQPA